MQRKVFYYLLNLIENKDIIGFIKKRVFNKNFNKKYLF